MKRGFLYLAAVIDRYSRFVLSWELPDSLDSGFCIQVLELALLGYGRPWIFNTDQGSKYQP